MKRADWIQERSAKSISGELPLGSDFECQLLADTKLGDSLGDIFEFDDCCSSVLFATPLLDG